ncbi:class C sortase [Bifidobacterium callimiconis]|uniref:class C sortase n=1 Tax=Bifidobacterium callimiconis TaxID=2306973 RepID=UPI001BDD752E|nr:class C sortase [Bifidobacterium callimiconis]MBT1176970.1 class C sortase [Bifidobacterium callimiconis]
MAVFFLILVIALAGWLISSRMQSDATQQRTVEQANQAASQLTGEQSSRALKEARAYNHKLFEDGQDDLGSIQDPYAAIQLQKAAVSKATAETGGSAAVNAHRTDAEVVAADQGEKSASDADYNRLVNIGDGIMGSLTIPSIDATMPIYHGTSNEALSSGAGHLYGTSLPVGGTDSHAVLTAHRGLVTADLFTRLDEVRKGDTFSIHVLGNTLNYRVDRISVVDPDDVSQLKITPGEDRVTLVTCTPYGVNTHRLLVSAIRTSDSAPASTGVSPVRLRHSWQYAAGVAAVIVLLGVMYLLVSRPPEPPLGSHLASAAQ